MRNSIILICLLLGLRAIGQNNISEDESNVALPEGKVTLLKLDVSNIINPIDPTLLLALEYRFNAKLSFSQEAGIITGSRRNEDITDGFIGFKVREELRYYWESDIAENVQPYLGFSAAYRYMTLRERGNVGYGCSNSSLWSCDYIQELNDPVTSHLIGGLIRMGLLTYVMPRLSLEGDFGFSMSYLSFDRNHGKNVTYFFDESMVNEQPRGFNLLPNFSIKVGYLLGQ